MKTKLKSLGIKLAELAKYLGISRPTLYKYIKYFDSKEFNSLNIKVKRIFDYIINEKTTSKMDVINYIANIDNDNEFDDIGDLKELLESDPKLKSEIKEVIDKNREAELIRINQKLTESIENLRKTETLLQASLNSFNDIIIFSIDNEYRYLYFNTVHKNVMKSFYGSDIEIGMNILDCITIKKDLSLEKSNYDRALSGESHTIIADTVSSEGEKRYFESFFSPIYNHENKIIGATGFARDITDRKKAFFGERKQLIEQLKKNEKDLLKSQAIAHLGTWRLDVKTNEVVWTEELYKMYGFDPKLPVPNYTEHMKLFKPKSWERLSSALELTRTKGIAYELELETVTKEGFNGWMWVRGEAEKDKDGKIIAIWGAAQDITERIRTLEQLKQNEKNLLEAQKIAKIGSWRLDVKTNQVEWSEELYKMYDIDSTLPTPDLMEQKKMFVPESWERLSNAIDLSISKGIPYELEVQTLKSDDTIGWMWTRAEIEKDINGKIIAIHGVAQDITERKLILDKLKRKEKQLLDSQSISQVGSFRLDLLTNKIEWTDEVYKMFGVDPTLPPLPYEEQVKTYTKDSWEKLSSAVDLTAKKGIGYALELEIVRVDGSNGWIWVKGEAEKDEHGKIVAILGAAQDITERKEQEDKLKQSEERFRVLHNASFGGIAIHNDGRILECNQGLSDVTGYSINELVGMNGLELIAPEDQEYVLKHIRNGIEKPYEVMGVRKNNERYHLKLEARNIPYKNDQVRVVEFRDISEQKRQEKELYQATYFDQLTGLYNRSQLINTLNEINMEKSPKIGMIIFDIDNLKLLNSHFDSSVGNEALMVAAKTLEQHISDDDMLFRSGGDEFATLVKDTDEKSLRELARKVALDFSGNTISGVSMTLSFGIAMLSSNNQDIGKIMVDAEEDLYRYKSIHMNSSHFSVLKMILGFLTEKFNYEKRHSEFVGMMSAKLGEHLLLSKDEVDELSIAGMFHDIGKITIPDEILNKPGKLTNAEFELIKQHSVIGHNIIKDAIPYSKLHKVILHHHERYDGLGYPGGLKGNEIPLLSRILCVVDAYEAMTSNRVYSKKMSKGEAVEELKRFKGIQFDPIITDTFIKIVLNKKEGDLVE